MVNNDEIKKFDKKIKVFFKGGETKEEKLLEVEDKEIEKIKKSIDFFIVKILKNFAFKRKILNFQRIII